MKEICLAAIFNHIHSNQWNKLCHITAFFSYDQKKKPKENHGFGDIFIALSGFKKKCFPELFKAFASFLCQNALF